jgi:hypothetical protein
MGPEAKGQHEDSLFPAGENVQRERRRSQGERIINPLKKRRKEPGGKGWRGIMDIRTGLALIPDPRIDRCKKHNPVDILLLCIIAHK